MTRGTSTKKDITNMPKVSKKSKVYRGFNDDKSAPADQIFNSKPHTDAKRGRYLADL